jgi:hypothetical protein
MCPQCLLPTETHLRNTDFTKLILLCEVHEIYFLYYYIFCVFNLIGIFDFVLSYNLRSFPKNDSSSQPYKSTKELLLLIFQLFSDVKIICSQNISKAFPASCHGIVAIVI